MDTSLVSHCCCVLLDVVSSSNIILLVVRSCNIANSSKCSRSHIMPEPGIAITEGGVIPATLVYLGGFYKSTELATRLAWFWGVQVF